MDERKRPIVARLVNLIWFLVTWGLLVTVVVAVLAGIYLYNRVDEEIRRKTEALLAEQFPHLHVSVRSARLLEREGFEIRGVSVSEPAQRGQPQLVAYLDEILVRCQPKLDDLIRQKIHIREVILRKSTLRCRRGSDGTWNVAQLAHWPALGKREHPTLHIEHGTVEIIDETVSPRRLYVVREVNAKVTPNDKVTVETEWQVEGSLAADHVSAANFRGKITSGGCWELTGDHIRFNFSPDFVQAVPAELAKGLTPLQTLRTHTQMTAQISYDPAAVPPLHYRIEGEAIDGRLEDPRLTYPLTDLATSFQWDSRHGLRLDNLSGRYGSAAVEMNVVCEGRAADAPWHLAGSVRDLQLDERLVSRLPERFQQQWRVFEPVGNLNARFEVEVSGHRWSPTVEIECRDVSLRWQRFPYPLRHATGRVAIRPDRLSFQLRATAADQPVRLRGEINHPGADWTGWCEGVSEGPLPIDEPLIAATPQSAQHVIRDFAPRGWLNFVARYQRHAPQEPVQTRMSINVVDGFVQHRSFPYPLQHVNARLERVNDDWRFYDVTGRNDSAHVTCEGRWDDGIDGGRLVLQFLATDVPLEDELRQALPATVQGVWTQLQPRGSFDQLAATLIYRRASGSNELAVTLQKWDAPHHADGRSLSITPTAFPYRIENLVGTVSYQDGHVQFQHLRGRHGQVALSARGSASSDTGGGWQVVLQDLTVDQLHIDSDVINASSVEFGRALTRIQLAGPLGLRGRVVLSGDPRVGPQTRIAWDLTADLENGSLSCGLPYQHISGAAHLIGDFDGTQLNCRGEVNVDSLTCEGVQLTQVQGPLWLNNERLLLGSWVPPAEHQSPPTPMAAEVFGGRLQTDAQVLLDESGSFESQSRLVNCDLAEIMRELSSETAAIRGRTYASLRLSGNKLGRHTYRGGGTIQLREANLYELPFVLALLRTVRTGSTSRTAFTATDVVYHLQGEHLYVDQIDLRGDTLALKGVGEMNMKREIDLDFYTVMGRDDLYFPAIRPFLGMASQRFLKVRVTGTLDQPQMTREVLPGLNETLQRLFPEQPTPAVAEASSIP